MAALTDDQKRAISELTYDDAANDSEWGKKQWDFSQYLQFDRQTARTLRRASDSDKAQLVDVLVNYLLDGEVPDYDDLPIVVATLAEHIITTDERTLTNLYVMRYKQHVAGRLKGRQKGNS